MNVDEQSTWGKDPQSDLRGLLPGYLTVSHSSTSEASGLDLVQSWASTATWQYVDDGGDVREDLASLAIGTAYWLLVDLSEGGGPVHRELDDLGVDEEILGQLLEGWEDSEDELLVYAQSAMLLTWVETIPEVRGSGLGRLLTKEAVRAATFAREETPVLLLAAPRVEREISDAKRRADERRLGALWATLGFEPHGGDHQARLGTSSAILTADLRPHVADWVIDAYHDRFGWFE
ncbi:MAG: hypothetical protein EOL89_02345 [Actinobacteria bacterium]|nr:hypothetical protein [Actinomycetota bacterium]